MVFVWHASVSSFEWMHCRQASQIVILRNSTSFKFTSLKYEVNLKLFSDFKLGGTMGSGDVPSSSFTSLDGAVRELQEQGRLPDLTKLRSSKYLNNLIEQDHRNVKSRLGTMLGLKSFTSATTTIQGIELMHRIRKGQFDLRGLGTQGQTPSEIWAAVLAA